MKPADAEALERAAKWSEAGDAWRQLAETAAARGHGNAPDLAVRAADAFRRDDRPAAAARMIRLALTLRPATVHDAAQLAGALADAGEIEAAADIAAAAVDGAEDQAGRALALDVATGTGLAAGRVPRARAFAAELEASPLVGAQLAARFRKAQLARLDGDLRYATAAWRGLVAQLTPHAAAAGALASAWMELGETAVLRAACRAAGVAWFAAQEDPDAVEEAEAEANFSAAAAAWTRAGRRAGLFRAEAWRLRVRAVQPTISTAIDTAIGYAQERGLAPLEAELRGLRAVVRRDPIDALHAVELATQAPLARGRARVIAGELGGRFDPSLALAELADDVPWRARAQVLAAAQGAGA